MAGVWRWPFCALLGLSSACSLRGTAELQSGFCTEAQIECDGACVDPRTDATHCGTCGYNCGLGRCEAGTCVLASLDGALTPEVGLGRPGAERWYAGGSAWAGLFAVPHDGSPLEDFQTGAAPVAAALDGNDLYWLDQRFNLVLRKTTLMDQSTPPCLNVDRGEPPDCPLAAVVPLVSGIAVSQAFVHWTADDEVRGVVKDGFGEAGTSVAFAGEASPGRIRVSQTNRLFWTAAGAVRTAGLSAAEPIVAHPQLETTPQRLALSPTGTSLCWAEWLVPAADNPSLLACADLSSDGTLAPAEYFATDPAIEVAHADDVVFWATAPRLAASPDAAPGQVLRRRRPFADNPPEVVFSDPGRDVYFVTIVGQEIFFASHAPGPQGVPGDTTFYRRHVDAIAIP